MSRYLLILVSLLALLTTSCTRGTQPPPPATNTKANPTTSAGSESKVVQITDGNYEEVVQSQNIVLIFFWAEWSAPDRMMSPFIDSLANEYQGRVKFGKVNVDENPQLSKKFRIKGIPTIVILKDGNEQERMVGVVPKTTITKPLEVLLNNN